MDLSNFQCPDSRIDLFVREDLLCGRNVTYEIQGSILDLLNPIIMHPLLDCSGTLSADTV